ncbi:cell division protein CrgA [Buchananella hordeovulneris]|uniref:Cell division protein CrgA n=1 Tax=Buchananella hordeovulneris TaxID=52770 RepID=A0A1Q5PV36_9ACTO|nr:cell division protein CrgA [Buchananella hordeovulneris]MDO5081447.1 cell division protein CrgA [Buchananella hordeovulneris]OKL51280.1 septation inhibitor protein [Buchananella hordeovulneris]RRD43410.1 cell division protein CrgA [Buchananella hordeovulneris]RRD51027.1 cell division protein CrgA [Buchananella hordeovulneris]
MPESKKRKSRGRTVHADTEIRPSWQDDIKPSPQWWPLVMVALMVLGLVWVVVTHMSSGRFPIPGLGDWNQFVGFGVMITGFLMMLRWR